MTYAAADTAVQTGRPLEFFRFANRASAWRFCTGRTQQTHASETYEPAAIERGAVEAAQEFGKATITVRVPYDNAVALLFVSGYPTGAVTLTIYRKHASDAEVITHWKGRVISAVFRGHVCELRCEPVFTALQRIGLRAVYQTQCRHVLYGAKCGVSKAAFAVPATVSTAVGNQVVYSSPTVRPDGYFTRGYLEAGSGSRLIVSHVGSTLILSAAVAGLVPGQPITLYPGCDLTPQTCTGKFANDINFGGFRWIPQKNPFAGDAII